MKIVIQEFDGDRAFVGGFKILIQSGRRKFVLQDDMGEEESRTYDTEEEKEAILRDYRKLAAAVAIDSGLKVVEKGIS